MTSRQSGRLLSPTTRFRKDYKKSKKDGKDLQLLKQVLHRLCFDLPLEERFLDHPLKGNWNGYRECHLTADWLLIYKKKGEDLFLARLGSHPELFE